MDPLTVGEAVVGGALVFFVPGYAVAKAVFPERRLAGADGVRWAVEVVALAFVLSVVLTVTVGYVLLVGAPGGFVASWSDPLLEAALAAIAGVAFAVGWLEGAYRRAPPRARRSDLEPGTGGPWELSAELARLQRERLGLERDLRGRPAADAEARLRARLARVLEEEEALRRRREADYEL